MIFSIPLPGTLQKLAVGCLGRVCCWELGPVPGLPPQHCPGCGVRREVKVWRGATSTHAMALVDAGNAGSTSGFTIAGVLLDLCRGHVLRLFLVLVLITQHSVC